MLPNQLLATALTAMMACALLAADSMAQVNSNRALMQRLDRIEKNMNTIQRQLSTRSNINQPSGDVDAKPIVTGNMDGDLLQQITALQEEMRSLRGEVEKNTYEIGRLKNQMKRLQDDIDFRLKKLEGNAQPIEPLEGGGNIDGTTNLTPSGTTTSGSGVLAKPGVKHADEPRRQYNNAFRLLNQNRYEDAEKAFRQFTSKYAKDPLIGNAYYWLGETFYIRQNYIEAADHFRAGYQALPDGPKAPDNLLKLAMTLKALDRADDACTIIEQIDKKFKKASANLLQRAKAEKKLMGCK